MCCIRYDTANKRSLYAINNALILIFVGRVKRTSEAERTFAPFWLKETNNLVFYSIRRVLLDVLSVSVIGKTAYVCIYVHFKRFSLLAILVTVSTRQSKLVMVSFAQQ